MQLIIKLNQSNAVPIASRFEIIDGIETEVKQYSWEDALKAAALELQALNTYSGTKEFPISLPCNPAAMVWVPDLAIDAGGVEPAHWEGQIEGFLGTTNTPPTADRGLVTVSIAEYEWLDTALFPQMPTTFSITVGDAPAGKII